MIRPLKGQVQVRLLPLQYEGLIFHEQPDGERMRPREAMVVAIGQWRTTKQGLSILPDFHVGQRVMVSEYLGTKLTREMGEDFRLCRIDDVLAVLEPELTA